MPLDTVFQFEEQERDGRWFDLPKEVGGQFFGVWMGAVGDEYKRRLEKFIETKRRQVGKVAKDKDGKYTEDLSIEEFGEALGHAMAGCTVRKIQGVFFQGEELESTLKNVRLVLSSSIVRGHCNDLIHDRNNFHILDAEEPEYPTETVEDAEGNLQGVSNATSPGIA